ncbi:MAG TPA: farnesyl-diphosphate synthase [Rhodospirillaceae bacterium]|nr:farnesyl-diphosphate synthase [Rhodospirillaceae bacterium]MAX60922.1 farnesyl-diphosphate synthase [Rhodospirillaceae bacterium]MAX65244.1 farnesyl-diphosphate synthase [Rhodospirillaceae bacterium]MBB55659.1 farnesyl-diphosphate synthase [Rhodospirillaceae bacterium]HAE03989.1 farnesyl-diphosphate synthase [Rhodospirillaceae bacterium]
MSDFAGHLEDVLNKLLPLDNAPERDLLEAMRYATLDGGKRVRPFLVNETAGLFGVSENSALRVGAALEMVHCYSLVHDDLPAMDDDALRRGKPTVHKRFDEATAILAGDALLTRAFNILASDSTHSNPAVRCELVLELSLAAGAHGMVGGQMIDLKAESADLDIGAITRLQRLKTGRLIDFGCQAGAILGRAPTSAREALRGYTHDMGLAFQIADDLLDITGDAATVGKAVGKDVTKGKATFVSVLGVERARDQANHLADQAINHLKLFDSKADHLRALARFVVERKH